MNRNEFARNLAAGTYDLIVLDLMLPGISGTEVLRRLRRNKRTAAVLVLTARDATTDKVENFEAGADDYLTKPFAFAELVVRVKSANFTFTKALWISRSAALVRSSCSRSVTS